MASGFLLPDLCNADETSVGEDIDENVTLSNHVRQTYFDYLHRVINENTNSTNATRESVMKIAQAIEMTAVKRALLTENYRIEMLKAIHDVQEKTVVHTVLEGVCSEETNNLNHSVAENTPCPKSPQDAPKDAYVYNSICAEMEKIFQEEPEIPSSPEDVSLCPIFWNSEYHIQKSLLIQLLNVISKFNPPKYLQLTEKLQLLFNMDLADNSLRGTPEPFHEIQYHCKKRIAQMLKHYIKPYYLLKHFNGNQMFKKFMRNCVHRLAQATPHIGNLNQELKIYLGLMQVFADARAIFKGVSKAFNSKEVRMIRENTVNAAIDSVVKHITNYNLYFKKDRNNRKKSSEEH